VVSLEYGSYFDMRFAHHTAGVKKRPLRGRARNFLNEHVPASLRPGVTMVLERGAGATRAT